MKYYKVLDSSDQIKSGVTFLIRSELYTEKERIKKGINVHHLTEVYINPKDTYKSFGARFETHYVFNLDYMINLGYIFENVDNINRVIRIKNSYNDIICSVFIESGFLDMQPGKIFNEKLSLLAALKRVGTKVFFKSLLK